MHNCRNISSLTRGSKIALNGFGWMATVSGNPRLSIEEAGSSMIRKLHSISAVVMKIEQFATCCPGHTLEMYGFRFRIHSIRYAPRPESKRAEFNVASDITRCVDPSLRVKRFGIWEDFWVICNCPGKRCSSIDHITI